MKAIRISGIILVAAATLMAQKTGGTTGSTSGTTGGGTSRPPIGGGTSPGQQPQIQQQPQTQQLPQQPPQQVYVYGKVILQDSTAPPIGTVIRKECYGSPVTIAFTSPNGQFTANLNSSGRTGMMFDASESPNDIFGTGGVNGQQQNQIGTSGGFNSNLAGCELIAELPGYQSDRISLSLRTQFDNGDVGTIVLHRLANVEGTSVSATSLLAPKDARKSWEKGVQQFHSAKSAKDGKLVSAEKELVNAVTIYPKFANAWTDLGKVRLMRQDSAGAREAFTKAIEADGKLVEPYISLGELSLREKDWQGASKYLGRALQLDSVEYPQLWLEDCISSYNTQDYDRAEKDARQALKVPPAKRNVHANELLGYILITKRDYAGAKDALTAYLSQAPNAPNAGEIRSKLAELDASAAAAAR